MVIPALIILCTKHTRSRDVVSDNLLLSVVMLEHMFVNLYYRTYNYASIHAVCSNEVDIYYGCVPLYWNVNKGTGVFIKTPPQGAFFAAETGISSIPLKYYNYI
jgi:hypothetical protein